MKRMIISPAQLKAINENAITTYDAPNLAAALNTYSTNVQQKDAPALLNIQSGQNNPAAKSLTVKTNDGQVDPNALAGQSDGNVKDITFSPMSEQQYSKRQVELGRMLEMRKNGKVFSKKQLNEMFMETQENADRLRAGIGKCQLFKIFEAVEDIFPEEVEGLKNAFSEGADIVEYLCNVFSKDGINGEREQEFLNRLGI